MPPDLPADERGRLTLTLGVARHSRAKVRPGGTLLFMSGTAGTYDVDGGQQLLPR